MSEPIVAVTKCADYSRHNIAKAVERQFELLGGIRKFINRGDSVLIKPNLIAPRPPERAVQTDPAVILEVARILKDFGANPFVADSPAWSNAAGCINALGLTEALKKMAVPVRQLNKPRTCYIGAEGTKVAISSVALDADVIINLPKFKAHQQLTATFAVKNMFGCVSGKQKAYWHFAKGKNKIEFCRFLIDIFRLLNPAVTIIDAVTVMDGPGPLSGRARHLGRLIGSTEPIACETVCAGLVNLKPQQIPVIKAAEKINFGCHNINNIKITGDKPFENICSDFEIPKPMPVRFSPVHVLQSICKQIFILIKQYL